MASGQTLRDAARAAGVGERTATRRWADPAFRLRVSELRGEMVGQALGRMADGMTEAADVLRGLLAAENEVVRLGAARSLLTLCVKLRESVELEKQVRDVIKQAEDIVKQAPRTPDHDTTPFEELPMGGGAP